MRVLSVAARAAVSACAVWGVAMLSIHPAAAEDNAAWFGSTFKGSNYGLGAGTMMKLGAGRHEGQTRRRTARGTQVAPSYSKASYVLFAVFAMRTRRFRATSFTRWLGA